MLGKDTIDKFKEDIKNVMDVELVAEVDFIDKVNYDSIGYVINDLLTECKATAVQELGIRYYSMLKAKYCI